MGKPNIGLLGMATLFTLTATLFSTSAYAQFSYWTGEGEYLSIPDSQIVSNGDGTISIITAEEATALEAEATTTTTTADSTGNVTVRPDDQDLDCADFYAQGMRNFPADSVDSRYDLDRDNDGIACEQQDITAAEAGQVVEEATQSVEQGTTTEPVFLQIMAELRITIVAIDNGNMQDAMTHIDNAISLLPEPQVQPEPTMQPVEPEVVMPEPVEPEVIIEEAEAQVPAETPVGTVQGNAIFADQLNLEAAGIFQECIDALVAASVVFIVGQAVEQAETPEQAETIANNTEAITEAVQNNTEITETVVDVVGENLGEIVSNQTTIEEVFEEEVEPEIQDEVPEVVAEAEAEDDIIIEEITI